MFNKRRKWSHSSLVKLPLVDMSASWFLVSKYLIWILGSKLILSNNQSRATLPMIILITASFFKDIQSLSALFCCVSHIAILSEFTFVMKVIKRAKRRSQSPLHFVSVRANLFTDPRMSGLPIRAWYLHFKTNCEHAFDNSPTDSSSSFLK